MGGRGGLASADSEGGGLNSSSIHTQGWLVHWWLLGRDESSATTGSGALVSERLMQCFNYSSGHNRVRQWMSAVIDGLYSATYSACRLGSGFQVASTRNLLPETIPPPPRFQAIALLIPSHSSLLTSCRGMHYSRFAFKLSHGKSQLRCGGHHGCRLYPIMVPMPPSGATGGSGTVTVTRSPGGLTLRPHQSVLPP